jgi:hypothetical protein
MTAVSYLPTGKPSNAYNSISPNCILIISDFAVKITANKFTLQSNFISAILYATACSGQLVWVPTTVQYFQLDDNYLQAIASGEWQKYEFYP